MKKIIKKILLGVIVAGIVVVPGFFDGQLVSAKKAFTLSPMSQRIILNPGEVFSGSINISNPTDSDENFNYLVELGPYYPAKLDDGIDDYGGASYDSKTDMNMIVDWTTLYITADSLKPGESKTIPFDISVPNNAPAGGQYMAILVREDKSDIPAQGDMAVREVMQMAHIIYAEVAGVTNKKGTIIENDLPSFSTTGNLKGHALIKNEGNVHSDAELVLQVWPLFSDEEICTNEEKPTSSLILPNTQRYMTSECNLPAVGIFRAKQTVRIFGEESVVEKTIIVCPIWLLFIILFVIILFVIWIFTRTKSKKSSKKAEN